MASCGKTFYIKELAIDNVRGFRDFRLQIPLKTPERDSRVQCLHRTVLLGRNGTCKTTFLRCLALGLAPQADANGLIAEPIGDLVADTTKPATIELKLGRVSVGGRPTTVRTEIRRARGVETAHRDGRVFEPEESIFVSGYGAGRAIEGPEVGRAYRIVDSVYGLFQYETNLIGTELTLRRLNDFLGEKLYHQTMRGIHRCLGLSDGDEIRLKKGGGVEIEGPSVNGTIPLQGWADGYRMTFLWIMDLYAWAMRAKAVTSSGKIRGVLLLDEVEQHLHPSMQSLLLGSLAKMLPEVQLFATTHSPLVALSVRPTELTVLRRSGNRVYGVQPLPDFRTYSAEDMLVDPRLFDTGAYSLEVQRALERYRELASLPPSRRKPSQRKELKQLARFLRTAEIPELHLEDLRKRVERIQEELDL